MKREKDSKNVKSFDFYGFAILTYLIWEHLWVKLQKNEIKISPKRKAIKPNYYVCHSLNFIELFYQNK